MEEKCQFKILIGDPKVGKWWEDMKWNKKKGANLWKEMKHNGILMVPPYEPLPKGVHILHNKKPLKLDSKDTKNEFNISAEEAAVLFARQIWADERLEKKRAEKKLNSKDSVFQNNFWGDWKKILKRAGAPIKALKEVDFKPIINYLAEEKKIKDEKKNNMTKEEKNEKKEEKKVVEDIYKYVIID